MPDEIYDVIDANGQTIGTATWTEVHEKGLLHQSVAVIVFKDMTKKEMLLQRRSEQMKQSPGQWQQAMGGHIVSGETPEEAVRKELQEEIFAGRPLPDVALEKVGVFFNDDLPGNREIGHLYEAIYPGPFSHSEEEVAEPLQWAQMEDLERDMKARPERYASIFHIVMREYRRIKSNH